MKILIVDDLQSRYDKISQIIREIYFSCQINVVSNAQNAKSLLVDHEFDLVVVDLNLPNMPGDEATAQAGISLLKELNKNSRYKKPFLSLGITSHDENFESNASELRLQNTFLIKYDSVSDDWIQVIRFSIYNIKKMRSNTLDMLFFTSIPAEESAVLRLNGISWMPRKIKINDYFSYSRGKIILNQKEYSVGCIKSPRVGMVESAIATSFALKELRPRLSIMVGICAGVKKDVNLGDVIVSSESWDWQSGKLIVQSGENILAIAPDTIKIGEVMRSSIENLITSLKTKSSLANLQLLHPDANNNVSSQILFAPTVSGSAVVANPSIIENIKGQHRKILGIDMEIFGFFAAHRANSLNGNDFLAVKSVSDFGDGDKDDRFHQYSSQISALVGFELSCSLLLDADSAND